MRVALCIRWSTVLPVLPSEDSPPWEHLSLFLHLYTRSRWCVWCQWFWMKKCMLLFVCVVSMYNCGGLILQGIMPGLPHVDCVSSRFHPVSSNTQIKRTTDLTTEQHCVEMKDPNRFLAVVLSRVSGGGDACILPSDQGCLSGSIAEPGTHSTLWLIQLSLTYCFFLPWLPSN